uniref:ribose-phosphate diphosphokinase n=1 Tax=viral metagenome TaxID=1070528 RepID=A0A6C0C9L1_9ZZZZ
MDVSKLHGVKLIAGRSNPELATEISKKIGVPLVPVKFVDFANTELNVEIEECVRGFHIYIIQSGCAYGGRSVNDHLFELFAMINACNLSSAKSVNLIMPCYAYARSDKKDAPRVPIMGACIATLLNSLVVKRVTSMDLHSGQIQGFFSRDPVDNLYAINTHCDNLKNSIFKGLTDEEINNKFIIASPDAGAIKRTESYAQKLNMKYVVMHKHRSYETKNTVLSTILIGAPDSVKNKTVIIIDDIVDTLGTMISAANELKLNGAKDVILVATHGLFSGAAIEKLNTCDMITNVIVTNTVPQKINQEKSSKISVVDISHLFASTIGKLQTCDSISKLF